MNITVLNLNREKRTLSDSRILSSDNRIEGADCWRLKWQDNSKLHGNDNQLHDSKHLPRRMQDDSMRGMSKWHLCMIQVKQVFQNFNDKLVYETPYRHQRQKQRHGELHGGSRTTNPSQDSEQTTVFWTTNTLVQKVEVICTKYYNL